MATSIAWEKEKMEEAREFGIDCPEYEKGDKLVYWERQGRSQMCGIHAVNGVMQCPIMTWDDFVDCAERVQWMERDLYVGDDVEPEHFDYSGNFSAEVLGVALDMNNLEWSQYSDASKVANLPLQHEAFIINTNNHWFALRKVEGEWYNLDSVASGPRLIKEDMVEVLQDYLRRGGSLFAVRQQQTSYRSDSHWSPLPGPFPWEPFAAGEVVLTKAMMKVYEEIACAQAARSLNVACNLQREVAVSPDDEAMESFPADGVEDPDAGDGFSPSDDPMTNKFVASNITGTTADAFDDDQSFTDSDCQHRTRWNY